MTSSDAIGNKMIIAKAIIPQIQNRSRLIEIE